ncbi:MAG: glycosyltransferase family 2 protein [Elusimicrobia bacterium]|nr:glycosyltransferase family 2 protein [Elusimicrobiota bacterium]
MEPSGRATIVIVTFHHRDVVERCLSAVIATVGADEEILVVDNASTDGTADVVERAAPRVRLVRSGWNLGYAGAGNLAARISSGDDLVFLNPDTEPRPGWLGALRDALRAVPRAALVGPKLLRSADPASLDALGVDVHLSGIPTSRSWGEEAARHGGVEDVASISGACFAVARRVFEELGGLDERAWYMEDVAISLRARLAGYRCVAIPGSEVLHLHPPGVWPAKLFYIERSRWWLILTTFRWRTILGLVPALVLSEAVAWAFAVSSGPAHVAAKARAWLDLIRWTSGIPDARRRTAELRLVTDRDLLRLHRTRLVFRQVRTGPIRAVGEPVTAALFAATRLLAEAMAK